MKRYQLYKFSNYAETMLLMQRFDDARADIIKEHAFAVGSPVVASPAERERLNKLVLAKAREYGVNEHGLSLTDVKRIEITPRSAPTHKFQVGSMFDTAGTYSMNNLLSGLGLYTLDSVFDGSVITVCDREYIAVNWRDAFDRVCDIKKGLMAKSSVEGQNIFADMCLTIDTSVPAVISPEQAIEWVRLTDDNGVYRFGHVMKDKPIMVKGVIAGSKGKTYVVFSANITWYVKALGIVMETIQVGLSDKSQDKYIICKYIE